MMNILAMGLVLSSLVTASFWSPSPENNHHQHEEAPLKERHRVLLVEYEQERNNDDGKSTHREVEMSTPEQLEGKSYFSEAKEKLSSGAEDVKEKARDAASVLPNLGQGLSGGVSDESRKGPGELICDAYGKCKHKIANALGKTKDTVAQTTGHVSEKAHDIKEGAKDTVAQTKGHVSEKAHDIKEGAKDTVGGVYDKAKDTVGGVYNKAGEIKEVAEDKIGHTYEMKEGAKEAVRDATGKVKETISDKLGSGRVGEAAKKTAEKLQSGAGTLLDTSDTLGKDVKKNVSMTTHKAEHQIQEATEQAREMAQSVKDEGENELKEILQRGKEVVRDMVKYAVPVKAVDGGLGVVQLLGLATAYGMSVWVTFMASYVLAAALPKQQFAVVQSKIYPVYFRAMATSIGVALLGYVLSQRSRLFTDKGVMFQGFTLLAPLLMALFNSMYLEPRATKVMFERMKLEKEEGRGQESSVIEPSRVADTMLNPSSGEGEHAIRQGTPVEQEPAKQRIITKNETLKNLNFYSSLLNVLSLISLTWHLVHLGQSVHLSR